LQLRALTVPRLCADVKLYMIDEKDYIHLKCRVPAGFPRMTQAEERLTRR
jgi:hypothetical protein